MFPTDQDVRRINDHTLTLAELLTEHTEGWDPPQLGDGNIVEALAQVHCHQHAVMSWDADKKLLEDCGVDVEQLESGCCGLAGNFGFTAGHGEVSEACAEHVLLPRLREAHPRTVVLADGFSCRTQIHELDSGGREAVHLAELLAAGRRGPVDGATMPLDRPTVPSSWARITATALAAGAAALTGLVAARLARRTVSQGWMRALHAVPGRAPAEGDNR
jgi:hypothetical protein